jgi:hypothetical protein
MIDFFYGQIENEHVFAPLLRSNKRFHAILLLGDKFKRDAFAKFAVAHMLGVDALEFAKSPILHTDVSVLSDDDSDVITVDSIRMLREELQRKACLALQRVCLIETAERMTFQAQNALLKLIEEPPGDAGFVFTASDKNGFLETILSRVVCVHLKPVTKDECLKVLMENEELPEGRARYLSDLFDGSLEWCVKVSRLGIGSEMLLLAEGFCECLEKKQIYNLAVELCKVKNREELTLFLCCLKYLLMQRRRLRESREVEAKNFLSLIEVANETLKKLGQNANFNLTLSWFLSCLCA